MFAKLRNLPQRQKHYLIFMAAITVAAFLIRLVIAYDLKHHYPPVTRPVEIADNYTYMVLARQILEGTFDYAKGFYYQPFYYAVFLPLLWWVTGPGIDPVIWCQSLLGAITCLLVGLMAARMAGRRAGILAAIFCALDRYLIFYTPVTLIASVQAFLFTLTAYLAQRAQLTRKYPLVLWAATGFVLGLSNLTRGNMILLLPVILPFVFLKASVLKQKLVQAVAFIIFFFLPQAPFTIINYHATGRWIGPSTAGPAVIALGNTPQSPPGELLYPETCNRWIAMHKAPPPEHVSLYRNVWNWIKTEPLAWGELKFRMILLFWNRIEIPNNIWLFFNGKPIAAKLIHLPFPILLDFWLIGSLGLAGVLFGCFFPSGHRLRLCAWLAAAYAGSIIAFYILSRFKVPVRPLLCALGAPVAVILWLRFQARLRELQHSVRPFYACLGLVAGCFLIVNGGFQYYRYFLEAGVMRLVRPHGVRVTFPEKTLVEDHGPFPLGGWTFEKFHSVTITKSFILPENLPPFRKVTLTFPLNSSSPATLRIHTARRVIPFQLKGGFENISIDLEPGEYSCNGNTITIPFRLTTPSRDTVGIFIDYQRNYSRTRINDLPYSGEMVVTLYLHHPPSSNMKTTPTQRKEN